MEIFLKFWKILLKKIRKLVRNRHVVLIYKIPSLSVHSILIGKKFDVAKEIAPLRITITLHI